jgi:hypothetical protein
MFPVALRAACAAAACAGSMLLAGCPAEESGDSGISPEGAQRSLNWAGYVKTGGPGTFFGAAGSWDVPAVTCSADQNSVSVTWAGVGGGTSEDPTLIQAGTSQDCFDGEAYYEAWWEAIPAPAVAAGGPLDSSYPVSAGDAMSVSVDGSDGVVWVIRIHNASRDWTFTTTVGYTAAGATAEWVEEVPVTAGTGGTALPLADFESVRFRGITANGVAASPSLDERVVMEDLDSNVIANTSAPSGAGFDVCYGPGDC